ncbi:MULTISPECIES: hypothetical protein [Microbacterium]|uniref:Uncharacterized protein n=1 Tax=Microbacterium gilvum TaxID=1336204 RepID=A0ABP9A1N8_9MICO
MSQPEAHKHAERAETLARMAKNQAQDPALRDLAHAVQELSAALKELTARPIR